MMDNRPPAATQDAKQQLVGMINDELAGLKRRISEIRGQITQQQTIVDREEQRNSDIAAHLITIRHSIDTIPREDVRDRYEEALEARQRLSTMRSQLERFQFTLEIMQQQLQLMQQIASKVQGADLTIDEEHEDGANAKAALNIKRIVEAQEVERQRLARQMHDGPAQSLTNFILQAEICQRLFDKSPQDAGEELNSLKTAAKLTLGKVRDFIFDLRPMMLDDLGVIPTVRRYVDSFREKNDIEIKLDILGEERRLQTHREVMIFRGIQELMGHARDYANASEISIRLDIGGTLVKISVEDNGRGFDAEAAFSNEDGQHAQDPRVQSLITLKEKFELIKGSASIVSGEADGTAVRLELPTSD